MIHEMSRSDRKSNVCVIRSTADTFKGDDHVLFTCGNLRDYEVVLAKLMTEYPDLDRGEAHEILCEDKAVADKYNFPSGSYAKFSPHFNEPTGFDTESVMLYETMVFTRDECWRDLNFCPLVKYGTTAGHPDPSKPKKVIELNEYPSDGDARFVQRWYPAI